MLNYFNLIREIAISDFKLKYQSSILGILWSFGKPLLMFGVLFFVFSSFVRFGGEVENYALHLLLGLILWNFFAESTLTSLNSLAGKAPLLKKIAFPRSIIIVSAVAAALLGLLFNIIVFAIFFVLSGMVFSWTIFLAAIFLIELFFVALGASFFISALYAKFKDVRHIWEIFLQIGFWITPIVYSVEMVPQKFHFPMYFFNPMTRIIQYSREAILQQRITNLDGMIGLLVLTLLVFFIGYFMYNKRSPHFAEEL